MQITGLVFSHAAKDNDELYFHFKVIFSFSVSRYLGLI